MHVYTPSNHACVYTPQKAHIFEEDNKCMWTVMNYIHVRSLHKCFEKDKKYIHTYEEIVFTVRGDYNGNPLHAIFNRIP